MKLLLAMHIPRRAWFSNFPPESVFWEARIFILPQKQRCKYLVKMIFCRGKSWCYKKVQDLSQIHIPIIILSTQQPQFNLLIYPQSVYSSVKWGNSFFSYFGRVVSQSSKIAIGKLFYNLYIPLHMGTIILSFPLKHQSSESTQLKVFQVTSERTYLSYSNEDVDKI